MSDFVRQTEKSPELLELFELLSQQMDGDLGPEEAQRLTVLRSAHATAADTFCRGSEKLGLLLKQLPSRPVTGLLFQAPTSSVKAVIVPDAPPVVRRNGSQKIVVGLVTSVLCAGLLFGLFRRSEILDSSAPTILATADRHSDSANAYGGGGFPGGPLEAEASMMGGDAMLKTMPPGAVEIPSAPMAAPVMALDTASVEMAAEPEVQTLIQSDDWNVVVVKIASRDRDQAMDQIHSIVSKAGLQLKVSAGNDESRWMGVILTSAVAGHDEVVNAMEDVGDSTSYTTATLPSDSVEARFIEAARESLKHPTRSELHHGKVFVALPPAPPSAAGSVVAASDEPQVGPAVAGTAGNPEAKVAAVDNEKPEMRSAKMAAKSVPAVTFVVFEFSDGEKSGPNNSSQQI